MKQCSQCGKFTVMNSMHAMDILNQVLLCDECYFVKLEPEMIKWIALFENMYSFLPGKYQYATIEWRDIGKAIKILACIQNSEKLWGKFITRLPEETQKEFRTLMNWKQEVDKETNAAVEEMFEFHCPEEIKDEEKKD